MTRSRGPARTFLGLLAVLAGLLPATSLAWNARAHRVIAAIAYQQLDEPTRQWLASVLQHHPAYQPLWIDRPGNGPNAVWNLLANASLFPDETHGDTWARYARPTAHYVNYRLMARAANRLEPPVPGDNILTSFAAHRRKLLDPQTSASDRALHLSWLLHQAGEIHQPLHAVARFSNARPQGDRGGNDVVVPNPRGPYENLHAYWDDLLGSDIDPRSVEQLATELIAEYPPGAFAAALVPASIDAWARESAALAVELVYGPLDPESTHLSTLPAGYEATALNLARERAALAGYRLARLLKSVANVQGPAADQLTQVSVINALMLGQYDGVATLQALLQHGDLGLGTVDHLDGELIILDGQPYQAMGNGSVARVPLNATTPFAVITPFEADENLPLPATSSLSMLDQTLEQLYPAPNQFLAIKVHASFNAVHLRSVRRQEPPYRPLAEVARDQAEWTRENLRGTLVGFKSPQWAGGLTVPGTHWHFLSDDRTIGGHVLDCSFGPTRILIDACTNWDIQLPQTERFNQSELTIDLRRELDAVERAREPRQP